MASESGNRYWSYPDVDEMLDATQTILRDAGFDGRQTIHPDFYEWFVEEISTVASDRRLAEFLFKVSVNEIVLGGEVDEVHELEALLARG